MDVEGVSVSITGIGLMLFLPGTFLVTFFFDILCREDWRQGYQPLMKNKRLDDLLSNRLVQICFIIIIQLLIMPLFSVFFPISLTGDTILNDALVIWQTWNAAQIAFVVVNIPWLLWLNYREYQVRRVMK